MSDSGESSEELCTDVEEQVNELSDETGENPQRKIWSMVLQEAIEAYNSENQFEKSAKLNQEFQKIYVETARE